MSDLEKALVKATGVKPQKSGEDRQKFLLRLMLGVQKLSSDEWEELGKIDGAQDWYNDAIAADNDEKDVPEMPDAEASGAEDEGGSDEEPDEEAPAGKGGKAADKKPASGKAADKKPAAAGKAADKKPAKADAKKDEGKKPAAKGAAGSKSAPAPAKKGTSMRRTLKQLVIKKPTIATDDLIEALEKKGFKAPSKLTVTSIRADTRDTMKVLVEAGLLDIEL